VGASSQAFCLSNGYYSIDPVSIRSSPRAL
jgi:hypothetical protein